jgi:hypothetical protein
MKQHIEAQIIINECKIIALREYTFNTDFQLKASILGRVNDLLIKKLNSLKGPKPL